MGTDARSAARKPQSLFGAVLIFCGFDITASKVTAIIVGVCFLITL